MIFRESSRAKMLVFFVEDDAVEVSDLYIKKSNGSEARKILPFLWQIETAKPTCSIIFPRSEASVI